MKSACEVAETGHHCVMVVKTAHSRFPKKFLEEKMKEFPGGTWIVFKGRGKQTNKELVAIGYKYNTKKVLQFITGGKYRESLPLSNEIQ